MSVSCSCFLSLFFFPVFFPVFFPSCPLLFPFLSGFVGLWGLFGLFGFFGSGSPLFSFSSLLFGLSIPNRNILTPNNHYNDLAKKAVLLFFALNLLKKTKLTKSFTQKTLNSKKPSLNPFNRSSRQTASVLNRHLGS